MRRTDTSAPQRIHVVQRCPLQLLVLLYMHLFKPHLSQQHLNLSQPPSGRPTTSTSTLTADTVTTTTTTTALNPIFCATSKLVMHLHCHLVNKPPVCRVQPLQHQKLGPLNINLEQADTPFVMQKRELG